MIVWMEHRLVNIWGYKGPIIEVPFWSMGCIVIITTSYDIVFGGVFGYNIDGIIV